MAQPRWCNRRRAIYAVQSMWCSLCGAIYALQSVGAIYVVQSMQCNLCGASYAAAAGRTAGQKCGHARRCDL
eukprot:1991795-Pyramimonas_sp.AAC.1